MNKISGMLKLDMVVHTYLSTWETETRGSEMEKRDHLPQSKEFEASMGYMELSPERASLSGEGVEM